MSFIWFITLYVGVWSTTEGIICDPNRVIHFAEYFAPYSVFGTLRCDCRHGPLRKKPTGGKDSVNKTDACIAQIMSAYAFSNHNLK